MDWGFPIVSTIRPASLLLRNADSSRLRMRGKIKSTIKKRVGEGKSKKEARVELNGRMGWDSNEWTNWWIGLI